MAAWMFYLNDQGVWDGDTKSVQELANNIINMATMYGVACCHHTCKNLDFNMKIIQSSSLSPQKKAEYADILSQATLTDPLYVVENAPTDGDGQSETNPSSSDEVLVNGTTQNNGEASGSVGGETPVGDQASTTPSADASSASSAQSSDSSSGDAGEDASQSSDSQAYEISKSSPAKSASAESSMPIVVIIAVIVLIAIFMVGYTRNKDDFDDY